MKEQVQSGDRFNQTYVMRNYLALSLSLGNLVMVSLCVLMTVGGFHYLLGIHMRETILISDVKNNQIRS